MKKFVYTLLFSILTLAASLKSRAQITPVIPEAPRVALFAPLFLDSCFDSKGAYKYGKMIPKFAIPGMEYYFGASLALDSLKKEGNPLHIKWFDSRSDKTPVNALVRSGALDSMDIIIGSVSGNDTRLLADYAKQKNIPFISGTFPNDAGITNNPNVAILNSTLKTHCETVYQYLQKNQSDRKIVVFTKPGRQEERIKTYFSDLEKNTSGPILALTYINLGADFHPDTLINFIDTTINTTYIAGSTDVNFGTAIAQGLVGAGQEANSFLVGMPTWDDITEFSKADYKNLNILYPVPMIMPPVNKIATDAAARFRKRFGSIAGENMYRGYEQVYHFCRLLLKYGKDLRDNFSDKNYILYSGYALQPVMLNNSQPTLDYFENKKIWLIHKYNGIVKNIVFP